MDKITKQRKYLSCSLRYRAPFRSENTITDHNALCLSPQNFAYVLSSVSLESWKWPREKLKTMLMQNFGVINKEHYGMLWYFLEWLILLQGENNAVQKVSVATIFKCFNVFKSLFTGSCSYLTPALTYFT